MPAHFNSPSTSFVQQDLWNLIVSVPDHCLFIYFVGPVNLLLQHNFYYYLIHLSIYFFVCVTNKLTACLHVFLLTVHPFHLFNRSKSIVEGAGDIPPRHSQLPRYSEGMLEPGMYTRTPGPLSIPTSHLERHRDPSAESLVGQVFINS